MFCLYLRKVPFTEDPVQTNYEKNRIVKRESLVQMQIYGAMAESEKYIFGAYIQLERDGNTE